MVTPEVFFKIVGMMLEDSRAEMKKLGILACAATTTYPMSFQLLAGASTNTRNDAAVKAEADKALNAYIEFSKLGVLERVLKGGAPSLAFTAAVLLEKSAQKNLGAQAQAGTAAPTPTPTPTVQQRTINAYKRFVDILGALTRTSPDPKVKTQAGQTLATLQGLLGNTATVAQQQ